MKNPKNIVGFERAAEYPLEPVLSFVQSRSNESADGGAAFFFATPGGFSQAFIGAAAITSLVSKPSGPPIVLPTASAPESPATVSTPSMSQREAKVSIPRAKNTPSVPEPGTAKKNKGSAAGTANSTPVVKQSSKVGSPVLVKTELNAQESETGSEQGSVRGKKNGLMVVRSEQDDGGVGSFNMEELAKIMKKVCRQLRLPATDVLIDNRWKTPSQVKSNNRSLPNYRH